VSWSPGRLRELADVFAAHAEAFVIEDDQFADAVDVRSGSLLGDPRIEDRVVYVRSFAKAIAPDLRLAIAATRPRLRSPLLEEKFFADGWCPRLAQTALAMAFASGSIDAALAEATATYARQRLELTTALLDQIGGRVDVRVPPASGSVNVWVQLPQGVSATEVAERAAEAGMIVATGEPFYIGVGHDDALRINAGSVPAGRASDVGRGLASVIADVSNSTSSTYLHHNL
jgi:DNA-binding transcriptional MocR family regulator